MELAVITLATFASSTAMSILAFMVGRCGRKLPIDGMLPRVVYSARFSPEKDGPRLVPEPARPNWPMPTKHLVNSGPALQMLGRHRTASYARRWTPRN